MRGRPANGPVMLDQRIRERVAALALVQGSGAYVHAKDVQLMALTALRLAREGHGPELAPLAGVVLLMELHHMDDGRYVLAQPEVAADVLDLVELADEQRDLIDLGTYLRARTTAEGSVAAKL